MKFSNLLEELKDIPTHNVVYHGTNLSSLLEILKSGFIKGSEFATKINNKNKIVELATSRKAGVTKIEKIKDKKEKQKDLMELSTSIGNVRFHLYKDRIIGNKEYRNIKIKPIAEIPLTNKNDWIKRNKNMINKSEKEKIKDFDEAFKFYSNMPNKELSDENAIIFNTFLKNKLGFLIYSITYSFYLAAMKDYYNYIINREYEERFVMPQNSKIYLNKDVLSIELLPGIVNDLLTGLQDFDILMSKLNNSSLEKNKEKKLKHLKVIYSLFKKNEELFIKNKEYEEFISLLKEKIKDLLTK